MMQFIVFGAHFGEIQTYSGVSALCLPTGRKKRCARAA